MSVIYSSAALKSKQREVKDAARNNVVHITENGGAAFVLLSEELYEEKLEEAREAAAYEERMRAVILAGRADIAEGRVIVGTENFFAQLETLRKSHG